MEKKPKIVVIGAGSASFGLSNLGAIMRTEELHGSRLALCDLNKDGLSLITKLANRVNEEWNAGMIIESSTNREELLEGANFVIISVAIDREKTWCSDVELGLKYGIRHYAENGGPGGFFHAARNTALIMPILKDIEKLAPDAQVLNFTNPMTRICTIAARYTNLKMVGICHQLDFAYLMVGRIIGKQFGLDVDNEYLFRWGNHEQALKIQKAAHERFEIKAAGINHFTWIMSIKDKKSGEELFPLFKKSFLLQKEFEPYTRKIIETFDECPTSGDAHCLEYMPYTSNVNRETWERYDIQMHPLKGQDVKRDEMWKQIERMADGLENIDYMKDVHTERAELIIKAMWEGENSLDMAVNLPNKNGYISNMERDAIVEVPAVIGLHGIQGVAVGDLPKIPAHFCNVQKNIVDLAVKSMVEMDYSSGLMALTIDPMVDDIEMAKCLLDDGLKMYEKYLGKFR